MINLNEQHSDEGFKKWQRKQRIARVVGGSLVILAGLFYLLYQMDFKIPGWVFTWPMILIGISLIVLVKHGLRDWRWVIPMLIGLLFLGGYIYPDSMILAYKIPIVLFLIGLAIIFKPRNRNHQYNHYRMHNMRRRKFGSSDNVPETTEEGFVYVNNVFGAVEKSVISKDFKGGDIRNTFAGCEINLMQADIDGEAVLMINQQCGGVKLMVPPHWIIKSEINCVFAGIEDKRPAVDMSNQNESKVLILRGTIFMSGLEIVSY